MNEDEPDLRNLFAHQREADHQAAPPFHGLMRRVRQRASPSRSHAGPAWRLAGFATAMALILLALAPVFKPRPSLTQVLPVLLESKPQAAPLFAQLTSSSHASGSDFLLPLHLTIDSL